MPWAVLDPHDCSSHSKWTAQDVEMCQDNALNSYLEVICQILAVTKINQCSPVIQSLKDKDFLYQLLRCVCQHISPVS